MPPVIAQARHSLTARLRAAVDRSRHYQVVYEDVLGEGPGSWHPGPRYPVDKVNCLVWLQTVLAEAFGSDQADRLRVMDNLRYFGDIPSFAMRKHYIEHWLAADPGPLRAVRLSGTLQPHAYRSRSEPQRFLAHREFEIGLYQMYRREFDFAYYEPWQIEEAARSALPAGFYCMFAVPMGSWYERFAERSGPIGLVHALLLEVPPHDAQGTTTSLIHHASIFVKAVVAEPLSIYLAKQRGLHLGYGLYALQPTWRPRPASLDAEGRRLVDREAALEANGFRPHRGF